MKEQIKISYGSAIREAFIYLLDTYPEVFVLGQGVWSPWYVGNSMRDLDKIYGKLRIIDTPVSEAVVTGAGLGAAISGMKPIIVHPRMDFMLYAIDQIVNQTAKWSHMFGGNCNNPSLTIRAMINRGGEQGAQHSQALHSWFAHIPGLRVVMPYGVLDARDLLIASVFCKDPVIYIDDRSLYEDSEDYKEIKFLNLKDEKPRKIIEGKDLTIISSGYSTKLAKKAIEEISNVFPNKTVELIDLRIISPLDISIIIESIKKTGSFIVIDGGWKTCGLGSELISSVMEKVDPYFVKNRPVNISLKESPAPSSKTLEEEYFTSIKEIFIEIENFLRKI